MAHGTSLPDVYVMSKFSTLSAELAKCLPENVNIVDVHVPGLEQMFKYDVIEVPEDALQTLKSAEIIVTDTTCLAYLLYRLPDVKWIQNTRAGVELLFEELDLKKPLPNFKVTRFADSYLSNLVANYVLAQIINVERKFFFYHDMQKLGKWQKHSSFANMRVLSDLTVGILGAGTVGGAVGRLLKAGGCRVLVFVRNERRGPSDRYDEAVTDLRSILHECDYVCNALPSTDRTRGLLDKDVLKNCLKKPVFINIGRGDIMKNSSIATALKNGWISGAILDVFEQEPLEPDSPLWKMPEVHITPHVAAIPDPKQIAKFVAANYLNYVKGEPLMNVVDWENGY